MNRTYQRRRLHHVTIAAVRVFLWGIRMPLINYTPDRKFTSATVEIIDSANEILNEYDEQGFVLTLRQLYYQFVSRDLLPNTDKSYNRLGSIINDARLAGLVDWDHLIDRTRNLQTLEHFDGAGDALTKLAGWYHVDMWRRQNVRPEVWIEKDALIGVIEGVCNELDVPYFSCRGYTSQSEMWRAGQRLRHWQDTCDQDTYIIHLGDHDPSGMDMSRDIFDRLELFMGGTKFERLALNMYQVEQYSPPPNPAKITDSRAKGYIQEYGDHSWELDALEPAVLSALIRKSVTDLRDDKIHSEDVKQKEVVREKLEEIAYNWED